MNAKERLKYLSKPEVSLRWKQAFLPRQLIYLFGCRLDFLPGGFSASCRFFQA